jgi:predicted nucleic acid-binding protein
MIYLDASCLVKLLRPEPQSEKVLAAVITERLVVVSNLAELEALVQLKAGYMAGAYGLSDWRKYEAKIAVLRNQEPFCFRAVPSGAWQIALRQHRNSGQTHCRTLDRLHLAIAEHFGASRIMTLDFSQATAARALHFVVVEPGRN